jgi:hypothetical protein
MFSGSKVDTVTKILPAVIEGESKPDDEENHNTFVYRYGNKTAMNLTPRLIDVTSGLSMNTNSSGKDVRFLVIKLISAGFLLTPTPNLYNPGHMSLFPGFGQASIAHWASYREKTDNSNPLTWHPLTTLLIALAE